MDTCPKCGFSLKWDLAVEDRADLQFCPRCGHDLSAYTAPGDVSEGLEAQVLDLLRKKQYTKETQLVREATGEGLRESRDRVDEISRRHYIPNALRDGLGLRFGVYLGVSVFLGLMVASAGIALFPQLGLIAKPFLCDGFLFVHSSPLQSPPGQAATTGGVSRSFACADGQERTLQVFFIATACYSVIFLFLLFLRWLIKRSRERKYRLQPSASANDPLLRRKK